MHELTLRWVEAGEWRTQTIWDRQPSKNPGTVRIGRDPTRCDIVLLHPTVSGLHVEIFYNCEEKYFYLRNLRDTNPPKVDGQKLSEGEAILSTGSLICLGKMKLKVISIDPIERHPMLVEAIAPNVGSETVSILPTRPLRMRPERPTYGLECPNCSKVSPCKLLDFGCAWCGTSLEAAVRVTIATASK